MKRPRLIIVIVVLLLLGGIALHLAWNREPRYDGRTVTQWLRDCPVASTDGRIKPTNFMTLQKNTRTAISHIDTNAIPVLLKMVTAHDTALEQRWKTWLNSRPWNRFHVRTARERREMAMVGFQFLGPEARRAAVPALVKLTKHPEPRTRGCAMFCLYNIHRDAQMIVPILLAALKDPDPLVRSYALTGLKRHYPEAAEKAGADQVFTMANSSSTNRVSTNAPEASK